MKLAAVLLLAAFCSSCTCFESTSSQSSKSAPKKQTVRTTAYTHSESDHRRYGRKTAIGTRLKYGDERSAAADWSVYPLGTKFKIKGEPHEYIVEDYGSALVGTETIDLYKPSRSSMNHWGVRHVDIEVLEWGCPHESMDVLRSRCRYSHCRAMYNDLQAENGSFEL